MKTQSNGLQQYFTDNLIYTVTTLFNVGFVALFFINKDYLIYTNALYIVLSALYFAGNLTSLFRKEEPAISNWAGGYLLISTLATIAISMYVIN